MNLITQIPAEYLIAGAVFAAILISVRFAERRIVNWIAYPAAIVIFVLTSLFDALKRLQIKMVKERAQHGSRWQVMGLFLTIAALGLAFSIMAKVFLVMIKANPMFSTASLMCSLLSKYTNLILLPEVLKYGDEKLSTFAWFNWGRTRVMAFWQWFIAQPVYQQLQTLRKALGARVRRIRVMTRWMIRRKLPWVRRLRAALRKRRGLLHKIVQRVRSRVAGMRTGR